MDRSEFNAHIINEIHSWSEEFYTNKIKEYAESMGLPTEQTVQRIMRSAPQRPRVNANGVSVCRGRLLSGKKCTRHGKFNGYCGYHKGQDTGEPEARQGGQIDWGRATVTEIPDGLAIP